jgi:hypothetical protein
MRIVRVLGTLEPGGAQLSALRLSVALRAHGIATTLLAGDATPAGLELADRHGLATEVFRVSDSVPAQSLQWTPSPKFADWLEPRLAGAGLVHGHMVGAWWAAAQSLPPGVPLAASEHNQMSWPAGDHTPRARDAARRVDLSSPRGRRPAPGRRGSAWTTAGCATGAHRWKACPPRRCRDSPRHGRLSPAGSAATRHQMCSSRCSP